MLWWGRALRQRRAVCDLIEVRPEERRESVMELFDIRTPQGAPTGDVKERSAVHRDGDWHGTAHIWLVRKREGRL